MSWRDWLGPGTVITLFGAIIGFLTWWSNRGKIKAESAALASGAALELLEPYREEVRSLRDEIEESRNEVKALRREMKLLESHLREREDLAAKQANLIDLQREAHRELMDEHEELVDWSAEAWTVLVQADPTFDPPPIDNFHIMPPGGGPA